MYERSSPFLLRSEMDHTALANRSLVHDLFFGTSFGGEGFGAARRSQIRMPPSPHLEINILGTCPFFYLRDLNNTMSNPNTNTVDECKETQ